MTAAATRMICSACGAEVSLPDELPFRCPEATGEDDRDHLLEKVLDPEGVTFAREGDSHPFLRYRELLHGYQLAREHGLSDGEWEDLVLDLDRKIAEIDGAGFAITPCERDESLSRHFGLNDTGGVWVKDETRNVAGSHKARHLFGIALWLKAFERLGFLAAGGEHHLAIASCGNAALAAAVVARALENPLEVFIPPHANPAIVARLGGLGARITTCPRGAGERGDPCLRAYRAALDHGALPFTVQGPENGLTIEGGSTLAYELVETLRERGVTPSQLFVQVGGGALASACLRGFEEAKLVGAWDAEVPELRPVQTAATSPLRAAQVALEERGASLREAAAARSEFMRAQEVVPSLAEGILDDETYDWRGVLRGTRRPVLTVEEAEIVAAHELANRGRAARVCGTGSAGLAGLGTTQLAPDESVVVIFTGVER